MKVSPILFLILAMIFISLPACNLPKDEAARPETHKLVVTSPKVKDVVLTQRYVCQIHSQQHIKVRALQSGYLEPIQIKEGQAVTAGEVLFKVIPTLYEARYNAEVAEVRLARLEYENTKRLAEENVKAVSQREVLLYEAKLAKAEAKLALAKAELDFTSVKAPFDGIINRLEEQRGSLIKEGDTLTTLSDNSLMWVYFNVPEARYLELKAELARRGCTESQGTKGAVLAELNRMVKVDLRLADGRKFPQTGTIGAIEGKFNNETGNIAFRADFPNPNRLLRHGQTGNILLHQTLKDAIVIPQRATYEILDKQYVYVIDKDDVAHQREIIVQNEMEDVFVIKKGLEPTDKIVLEGGRQVHDGEKVEAGYEFRKPEDALSNQKNYAE